MLISKICSIFAKKIATVLFFLREQTINLNNMKPTNFWKQSRKILINKYAITLYVFAALFLFVGEQSLINQFARKREIRKTRQKIEHIKIETAESTNLLQSLDNKDSLERFAREQYKMHADDETIYLVE